MLTDVKEDDFGPSVCFEDHEQLCQIFLSLVFFRCSALFWELVIAHTPSYTEQSSLNHSFSLKSCGCD